MKHLDPESQVVSGTVMVQQGLLLPQGILATTQAYSAGWRTLTGTDGFTFDRELRRVGWGSFFVAGDLNTVSFGISHAGMLRAAVGRFLSKVRALDFNCAEFTTIVSSRFLGIPFVRVSGHARHIQQGSVLESAPQRDQQQLQVDALRDQPPQAATGS